MDETYDLTDEPTPPPKPDAPKYLPRIRNYPGAEPAPEESVESEPKAKAGKPKPEKTPKPVRTPRATGPDAMSSRGEGDRKGALLEETPEFDTVETRSKIRIAIGVAAVGLIVMVGWTIFNAVSPDGPELADEGNVEFSEPAPTLKVASREQLEGEARLVLADARSFAKRGDADNTLKRLNKILETYPKSAAAAEAKAALERAEQGLPVFPDGTLVIARNDRAPEGTVESPIEVVASAPQATIPVGTAYVSVQPPLTPPDPYRALALPLQLGTIAANALPEGFRPRIEAGVHPSGWPWEITCDQDGAAMRFIPPGEYLMGRDAGPIQERPAHKVALGGYYIDQHETTVRQYARFQAATGDSTADGSISASEDTPIADITWTQANAYLKWCRKQLPTEAQWEASARTIDGRLYPWGPDAPPWPEPRQALPLNPVMSQPLDMSPYGVFDLAGNVNEWTADWYDPRYFQQFKDTVAVDPTGPERLRSKLPTRVVKGGAKTWEACWREGARPESHTASLGFRGVLTVEKSSVPVPDSPATPTSVTPQRPPKSFVAF
jgi:hypothetical protein